MTELTKQEILKNLGKIYNIQPQKVSKENEEEVDYYINLALEEKKSKKKPGFSKSSNKNTAEKVIKKYTTEEERRSITENIISTVSPFIEKLENLQRGQYAVENVLYQKLKTIKDPTAKDIKLQDILSATTGSILTEKEFEAFKKGFNLEEKHDARDLIKLAMPEAVNWLEENTNVKLFNIGGKTVYDVDSSPEGMTKEEFGKVLSAASSMIPFGAMNDIEDRDYKFTYLGKEYNVKKRTKGGITFDADVLSIPAFLADTLLDPVTYIPFGAPFKWAKQIINKGEEAAKIATGAVKATKLGKTAEGAIKKSFDSGVGKILSENLNKALPKETIENIKDVALAQYAKFFDKRSAWKIKTEDGKVDLRDIYDYRKKQINKITNSDIVEDKIKGLITVGEKTELDKQVKNFTDPLIDSKNLFIKDKRIFMDENQSKEVFDAFKKSNDEFVDLIDARVAKELNVSVDQFLELKGVDEIVKNYKYMETVDPDEASKVLKELESRLTKKFTSKQATTNLQKIEKRRNNLVKQAVEQIKKDGGLRKVAKGIAKQEEMISLDHLKTKTRINLDANQKALKELNAKKKNLFKALKNETGSAIKLYENDLSDTLKKIKVLNQNVDTLVKGDFDDKVAGLFKDKISEVQKSIRQHEAKRSLIFQSLKKESMEKLENTTARKAMNHLKKQTDKLNNLMSKANVYGVNSLKKDLKDVVVEYKKALKGIKKIQKEEIKNVAEMASKDAKGLKSLVKENLNKYKEEIDLITNTESDLVKGMKVIQKKSQADALRISKTSRVMENRYYKGLRMLKRDNARQKIINSMSDEIDSLFAKHVSDLPKELQEPMKNIHKYFRNAGRQGVEAGVFKGINPIYAPRKFEQKWYENLKRTMMSPYRDKSPSFSASMKRKLAKYGESLEYMKSQGFEPVEDMRVLLYDYMESFELKLSKAQLEKDVMRRLNVSHKSDLPKDLLAQIDDLYTRTNSITFNNPVLDLVAKGWNKGTRAYKMLLTLPNIAFQSRNVQGFPFLAATTAGMKQGFNPKNWTDSFLIKAGHKGNLDVFLKDGTKKSYSFYNLRKVMEKDGYFATSYWRGDIGKNKKAIFNQYDTKSPIQTFKKFVHNFYATSANIEDIGRTNAFVSNLRAGQDVPEALKNARKAMFDYDVSNSAVDKALQSTLMFYTFSRRNLPMQVRTMLMDPKQYAMRSRLIQKMSNYEDLSDEEIKLLSESDKATYQFYGEVVDGVREYRRGGWDPAEEAYGTIMGFVEKENITKKFQRIVGKIDPQAQAFVEYVYDKDLYYGGEMPTHLHEGYAKIIPKPVQKMLGLKEEEITKYRGGVPIGKRKILTGNAKSIFMIRKMPTSRMVQDIANAMKNDDLFGYITAVKKGELDVTKRKFYIKKSVKEALTKKAVKKGAKELKILYDSNKKKKRKGFKAR